MREFKGKTAFVTGGASGIGLALGRAFAQAGMKVMLADIEPKALDSALRELHEFSPNVRGVGCDVADPHSVERAAHATYEAFGNVHVICNNAGVAAGGGIDAISLDNWRWVIDVNLMGVLHGISSFLPHMRAHGEGGHIVNTASMAGLNSGMGFSPYAASKFAVIAMSGGAGDAAEAVWHRRERALPKLRAHTYRRERTQSAGALRRGSATRSGKSGGNDGGGNRSTARVRARPCGGRGKSSFGDPAGRALCVHAPGHARGGQRAVCRYPGRHGQGDGALSCKITHVRLALTAFPARKTTLDMPRRTASVAA